MLKAPTKTVTRMKRRIARTNKRRRLKWTIVATTFILVGISVLTFPYAANWWSATGQHEEILNYTVRVNDQVRAQFQTALDKNTAGDPQGALASMSVQGSPSIGSVAIANVGIDVPLYPTSTPADLDRGAGHVEGTSAPVGGAGTHAALSAHTGMPTAAMFDRLDDVKVADTVLVRTLGQLLEYSVIEIIVDTPEDGGARLQPQVGRDLLTLITCTPYGVNTHRLLVTAERKVTDAPKGQPTSDMEVPTAVPAPKWALIYGLSIAIVLTGAVVSFRSAMPLAPTLRTARPHLAAVMHPTSVSPDEVVPPDR